MTTEHWDNIQDILEDINSDIETIAETVPRNDTVRAMVSNIYQYTNTLYSVCEDDYCNDSTDDLPHGYEEIWPMLPNGNNLSVGDMNRLKAYIEAWLRGE